MSNFFTTLQSKMAESLPGVAGALVILLVGWFVAVAIRTVIGKTLGLLKLNDKVNGQGPKEQGSALDLEKVLSTGAYYVVLLIVLLAVFNQLGLDVVSQPIQGLVTQALDFLPKLAAGAMLFLVAWLCGNILKQVVTGGTAAVGLDDKLSDTKKPVSEVLGSVSFWVVILLFLPGVLEVFGLSTLMEPAEGMINQMLSMLPNIFGAIVIAVVGWFIAKIVRDVVTNLLGVAGVDNLVEKLGVPDDTKLSNIIGMIIYFFILSSSLIAALDKLQIEAISTPAKEMLDKIIGAIPQVASALALILVTYVIAKPVASFVSNILSAAGVDNLPETLGFKKPKNAKATSNLGGKIVFFFMLLFASVEAANIMNFGQFSELVSTFIQFGGQVLLGSAIIAIGLWIANLASAAISQRKGKGQEFMAGLVRVVILGLVFAMGLRAMGLANDIVNMAFGLTLGAAAVAFALSFGLGGREAAGKQTEYWFSQLRNDK